MKRQEKYPETTTFHFYNANPKGKITTDCVIRAICTALDMPYTTVLLEMAEQQCRTGLDMSEKKAIDKYLQSKGWIKMSQPRKFDNTKYTGKEFCEELQQSTFTPFGEKLLTQDRGRRAKRIVANVGGHHVVAIVNGKIYDHWNSTDGSVGNYWIKL